MSVISTQHCSCSCRNQGTLLVLLQWTSLATGLEMYVWAQFQAMIQCMLTKINYAPV